MNPVALFAAIAIGIAGSVVWALISYFINFEVVYIAWGIGALIGMGTVALGGRGSQMALAGGAIALASIFAGKMAAVSMDLGQAEGEIAADLDSSLFEELKAESALFVDLKEADYPEFLIDQGYSEAEEPSDVDSSEIEAWLATLVPVYDEMRKGEIDEDEFRTLYAGLLVAYNLQNMSLAEIVTDELDIIDLIFAILGVASAFVIIRKAEGRVTTEPDTMAADG